MGNVCIRGEQYIDPAGKEDEDKPFAFLTEVMLQNRRIIPVWVLPTDSMKQLNDKVVLMHGDQGSEKLMIFRAHRLAEVEMDVTVQETGARYFRYATKRKSGVDSITCNNFCFTKRNVRCGITPSQGEEYRSLFYPEIEFIL